MKNTNRTKKLSEFLLLTLEKIELWGGMLTFVFLLGILSIGIFFRYVLNFPLMGVRDLSLLFFTWLTFLGISLTYKKKRHPEVRFLARALPPLAQKCLRLFANFCIVLFLAFLVFHTIKWQKTQLKYTTIALEIPLVFFSSSILFSGISMLSSAIYSTLIEIKQIMRTK